AAVVITGAQIAVLGDADIVADGYGAERIELHPLTDPAMIPDRDLPGIGDARARLDARLVPDPGAEQPQQPSAEAVERGGRGAEQQRIGDPPQHHDMVGPSPEAGGNAKAGQVLYGTVVLAQDGMPFPDLLSTASRSALLVAAAARPISKWSRKARRASSPIADFSSGGRARKRASRLAIPAAVSASTNPLPDASTSRQI